MDGPVRRSVMPAVFQIVYNARENQDWGGYAMPVHDWTRVDAGIFHAFHHGWIEELARALNRGVLPSDYYALPEQHAAGFGPDVLTLQGSGWDDGGDETDAAVPKGNGVALAVPKLQP